MAKHAKSYKIPQYAAAAAAAKKYDLSFATGKSICDPQIIDNRCLTYISEGYHYF